MRQKGELCPVFLLGSLPLSMIRAVQCFVDFFALLIDLIIFCTLMRDKVGKQIFSIRSLRYVSAVFAIDAVADILVSASYKVPELYPLFRTMIYLAYVTANATYLSLFLFVCHFIGEDAPVPRTARIVFHVAIAVLDVCFLTPGLQELVLVVYPSSTATEGPLYYLALLAYAFVSLYPVVLLLRNFRRIRRSYTLTLCLFLLLPNVLYLLTYPVTCFSRLLSSIFLLTTDLLIYQDRARLSLIQEKELADTRTKLVLSQIKPHFLYNTIGSISRLCVVDPPKAQELSDRFASYLRGNLSSLDATRLIPFRQELSHVKTYLEIELVRFPNRLRADFDITVFDFSLPALSVQPLVENAVKHGICRKEEGGTVTVSTSETATHWLVTVRDDGLGFDPSAVMELSGDHVGLHNVRERVRILCNGDLTIESAPDAGTVATLYIPKGG